MYLFSIKSNRKMQLKIHKEGLVYFVSLLIITIVTLPFFPIVGLILLVITCYIFYFFRDPIRSIPIEDCIISPADGTVTYIGKSEPPIEIQSNLKFIRISIFLNIFNVHVNRVPITGVVRKIKYISGKYLNATLNKSSNENERNIVVLENHKQEFIIITQIAGLIARRIVCDLKLEQEVKKGNRYGIIKFGSRVDIYLPSSYKILVTMGQTVLGGETIISNPNNIKEITGSVKN